MDKASFVGVLKEYKDITIPVPWAKIQFKGTEFETYSDGRGFFAFGGLSGWSGSNAGALIISADGYETLEYPVELGQTDLGIIFLKPLLRDINPITVNDLMPAGPEVSGQMISKPGAAALYWSDDVLASAANYGLGMLGFKMRGYDYNNTEFYINGASLTDPASGYARADLFAGLNAAVHKNADGSRRIINDKMFYGDLGGYSSIRINPLSMRPQFKASYSLSNALYTHGLNASYSTGEMPGGLALTVMLSARTGEGFAEGTDYKSMSYLFAVGKAIDEFNDLTFFALGAPTKRGGRNYSTQALYDDNGGNYYNSAWGYDNGDKRNYRVTQFFRPVLGAEYNREGEVSQWNTSLAFTFGNSSETDLLWAGTVPDLLADSYAGAKMPPASFYPQVPWDVMRAANDTADDKRSQYIADGQYSGGSMISLNSVYDLYDWGNLATTAGVEFKLYNGTFHDEVDDLLGGAYWLNVDKFLPADAPANSSDPRYQYDVDHPNRKVGVGGKIGYDYSVQQQSYKLWNIWRYFWHRFKFSLGGSASYTNYLYVANVVNGKFSDAANGQPRQKFFNYTGKAGVAYKLAPSNDVEINAMYGKRAPLFANAYLAPRITGETVDGLKNETVMSGELNYTLANTIMTIHASGFYTLLKNQTVVRSYYDDYYLSRMSLGISGLNSRYLGGDMSAKIKIMPELAAKLAVSYGVYKYTSDPVATLMQENTGEKLLAYDTLRMNGLSVAGTPQTAFTGGLMYDSPQRWWAGFNANYAGNNYADVNPLRLSSASLDLGSDQAKLKGMFTLDFYGGYTFAFGENKKKALSLNVNIQNILGTQSGYLGAYEPFGIVTADNAGRYDTRYAYAYGRTMFLMLSFIF